MQAEVLLLFETYVDERLDVSQDPEMSDIDWMHTIIRMVMFLDAFVWVQLLLVKECSQYSIAKIRYYSKAKYVITFSQQPSNCVRGTRITWVLALTSLPQALGWKSHDQYPPNLDPFSHKIKDLPFSFTPNTKHRSQPSPLL